MLKKINEIKVNIILPNYNSGHFLEETINSILNQTFKNWKLIIVDDGSNLNDKKILQKYRNYNKINIIFLKKNKGAGFCRNLAIKHSKGDYLAFIDSDDIWYKNKLLDQIKFMVKNNYQFTYTNYVTFSNKAKRMKKKNIENTIKPPKKFNFNKFIHNTSIGTSTMILKRSLIKNIKFTKTKICEDYFFKCKILKKIDYAYCLPKVLTKYRIRTNSLQGNRFRNLYWIWYINKNYNQLNLINNLLSLFSISFNSLMKYGLK
jgi:teichuronic acid biosynthesis glycosyltransferase TuaG